MTRPATLASPHPLTTEELLVADQTARRLHAEFRGLLNAIPDDARNATGLARHLHVERTTCHRFLAAAREQRPDAALLVAVPGLKGLHQILEGARDAGIDPAAVARLEAAVARFDATLKRLGRSQSRLAKRLDATQRVDSALTADGEPSRSTADADDSTLTRSRLFDAAAEMTGRRSEAQITITAIRPQAGDPTAAEAARVKGFIGHAQRAHALPLVMLTGPQLSDEHNPVPAYRSLKDESTAGYDQHSFLLDYCSRSVTPRLVNNVRNKRLTQTLDADAQGFDHPFDVVLGNRIEEFWRLPRGRGDTPVPDGELWALIDFPVRRLVVDVYLHRDIAAMCVPTCDAHLYQPNLGETAGDRWETRFPTEPRLEFLGQGTARAANPAYPRHAELTDEMFNELGWNTANFLGYRCAVEYPIWRAGYRMWFRFLDNEPEPDQPEDA